jgi:hypothetical protein
MRYFVTTRIAPAAVKGKLPLTADEALRFVAAAKKDGLKVEIVDESGARVSIAQLRRAVRRK